MRRHTSDPVTNVAVPENSNEVTVNEDDNYFGRAYFEELYSNADPSKILQFQDKVDDYHVAGDVDGYTADSIEETIAKLLEDVDVVGVDTLGNTAAEALRINIQQSSQGLGSQNTNNTVDNENNHGFSL